MTKERETYTKDLIKNVHKRLDQNVHSRLENLHKYPPKIN